MKKHTLRTILLIVVGFLLGLAVVGPMFLFQTTEKEAVVAAKPTTHQKSLSVSVTMPRLEMVLDGIRSVGTLRPIESVDLSSEVSGKVSKILFEEGQKVKKDQILVTINDDDLRAKMQRYTFQERTLGEKLERQRVLLESEAISQEAYDGVETEYNVLRADMAILEVAIKRSVVRAPFDGVIGLRYISEGAYVQPSTLIAKIVDQSKLRVEFSIPEKYISQQLIGQKIYFTTEGSDSKNEARIYAMEPHIDEATRTIILRALFNNSAGRVMAGMSTRVTIPTSAESTRLLIPSQTIVPTMSGKSVWVVSGGRATERTVITGARLESDVEVIDGLSVGDTVIVNGIMHVREGMPVEIK